jgi:hypothetical protein
MIVLASRRFRRLIAAALFTGLIGTAPTRAAPDPATASTIQHLVCRMVDQAAAVHKLPVGFLTRLIWQESRFRSDATSPKGAEGIAQFLPQTAAERGLADPRDPGQAVNHAARLLIELEARFGNLGLAAAAYNAGAARVTKWLAGEATLPSETRAYVTAVTGRTAENWVDLRGRGRIELSADDEPCISLTAQLARASFGRAVPDAMWQARLDGTLTKAIEGLTLMARHQRLDGKRPATRGIAKALCDSARGLVASCTVDER